MVVFICLKSIFCSYYIFKILICWCLKRWHTRIVFFAEVLCKLWFLSWSWVNHLINYSPHQLIQVLVIQPIYLMWPFPLNTLLWLPMLKAAINLTLLRVFFGLIVYRNGGIVKDPMKSVSFVPKTISAGGAFQSPLDRLSGLKPLPSPPFWYTGCHC